MDPHAMFRRAGADADELRQSANDGYEPVVEVWLAHRAEPVEAVFVTTYKADDNPWVRLQEGDGAEPETVRIIYAHESTVLGAEVSMRAQSMGVPKSVGFTANVESMD